MKRLTIAMFAAVVAGSAAAQGYPNKTISIVVPFAAGGPTDIIARLVGESMTKTLGQQVIIDNVAGAGGTIGAARVARAKPDGYTLLVHHVGVATSATLYRKLDFDSRTAYQPIGLLTNGPMLLIANTDFPPNTAQELIDHLKKNGDKITFANAGTGSSSHLCGMVLESVLKVKLTTVPYKGTGPVMQDLRGKQVDMSCDQATNATTPVKGKFIKGYVVTSPKRMETLPEIPSTSEVADLKALDLNIWNAMFAPKGTPPDIVKKVNDALKVALKDEKVVARLRDLNTEPVSQDQAEPDILGKLVLSEIDRWAPLIHASGQYAD